MFERFFGAAKLKVIIIGAGVMGMMQARELALQGVEVVLLDKGLSGTEASWAGGGIVSPLYPWRYPEAVTALASWSQAYYPNLIQSLEAESDIDPELTRHGLMMLDVDDWECALDWAAQNQAWLEPVDHAQIYKLEPGLREGCIEALWMSQVSSVRNPRLLKALRVVIDKDPLIELREVSPVANLLASDGGHANGVRLESGEQILGDKILFCSGAWTPQFFPELDIKVLPIKGQMVLFDAEPGLINRVVLSQGKYVIPRRDGKVVAGSTLENTGFDKSTTHEAREALADMAIDLFPELAAYPIAGHWAGLRPSSPSGIPYIGRVPNYTNVYINAGHFRNGLVLAPASVRLMTETLCEQATSLDISPYEPSLRVKVANTP